MTSKEALEQLEQYITNKKGRLSIFIKLYFEIIKQDLERLKVLEKENKEYFDTICKQAYLLNNKHIDKPIIEMYIQENEKLKSIIKENFGYSETTDRVFFNYTEPVMEDEIIEVLNNE